MSLGAQSLIVIILVGLVAGWLAGQIMRGYGFGLVGDIIIGIIGAFVGNWLLGQLHVTIAAGIIGLIINATIGAVVVLFVLRLIRR